MNVKKLIEEVADGRDPLEVIDETVSGRFVSNVQGWGREKQILNSVNEYVGKIRGQSGSWVIVDPPDLKLESFPSVDDAAAAIYEHSGDKRMIQRLRRAGVVR